MPTYEYRCDKCGQHLEVVQSFADRPLRRHRQCGGDLARVFHPRGVVFKGSGFYKNDSRPAESKDGDSTTKKSTEKKSEPAPAATSAAGSDAAD